MNTKPRRVLLFHSVPSKDSHSDPDFRISPIGLFFIAGALRKNGYETLILPVLSPVFLEQSTPDQGYGKELREKIQAFDPDYIGYSFRNLYNLGQPLARTGSLTDFFCVSQDAPVIEFIRTCSGAPIIGGGAAFSLAPELYMKTLPLDYGIQGEGDRLLVALLDMLDHGQNTDALPGLVYRKGGDIWKNPVDSRGGGASYTMDLSALDEHKDLYYDRGGYGSVQTKRGCGFHCSYCVYPYLEGTAYRLRPVGEIVEELETYQNRYGIRHIYFVDSVFSSPSIHSRAIVEAMVEKGLDIRWYAYVNPSGLTRELLTTYRESGCAGLVLTLESGSDLILSRLSKGFSKQDSAAAVENLVHAGIPFEVSMMTGTPGESEETLNETLVFCRNHLANVPVIFTQGVWMHPVSPIFAEYHSKINQDVDALSGLVLSNDVKGHNALHYYFSEQDNRNELIRRFYREAAKEPLWFILGKDMIPDAQAGIMRFPKTDRIKRYDRPWFSGLQDGVGFI